VSESDDELIEGLRSAARAADPVPDAVIQRAKSALGQRRPQAEIARISHGSWRTGATRHRGGPRRLRFEAARLGIEVEVWAAGDRRRIVGRLRPAQPAVVELRTTATSETTYAEVDEHGRFELDAPAGPLSLSCRLTGASRTVDTEWIAF
jgi:hypothetical protein